MLDVLPRIIEPLLDTMMGFSPVVILEGGRAVGKSTVCDRLTDRNHWPARHDLSDADTLDALRLDPTRFLAGQALPCVLDEAQLEPQLPLWIKQIVDRKREPGQFLLTGSARLGRQQLGGSDPLAGRAVRLTMWSMTQLELDSRPADFLERAFGSGWTPGLASASTGSRNAWLGGLPAISGVRREAPAWQWEREIAAYVEAVIPLGVAGTRADLGRLTRTLRYLAANSGQLLNFARAASDLAVQASTVRHHLELLEACFLLFRVEADRPAEHRVVAAHPRVFAADPGLATWAARALASPGSAALRGSLAETVVAHDLAAQAGAHPDRIALRHWRDERNRREVDLLLVHPDGLRLG